MFQMPLLITLSIAATRLYRSLAEFVSESTEMYEPFSFGFSPCSCRFSAQKNAGGHTALSAAWAPAVSPRSNQIDGTVHTVYEQHMTSQMSHHMHHGSHISYPTSRLSRENELESGMEN